MRKIEKEMVSAVVDGRNWKSGNTEVVYSEGSNVCDVYLFGHHIACCTAGDLWGSKVAVNIKTLRHYPTATTKSRLRALGAKVTTSKGRTFVDEVEI